MSDKKETKSKSELEESENKTDTIPILLLSKDLMNQLDSNSDDDDIIKLEKDENNIKDINKYFHSSESSNDDEEPESKTKEKEIQNQNFNYDFFKSKNEGKNNIKNSEIQNGQNNNEIFQSKLYNSSLLYENIPKYENIINKNNNRLGGEGEKQIFINRNNNNNNYYNINSCFTMNGKPGWICFYCKNFNYESK